jgi:hypothetical protein
MTNVTGEESFRNGLNPDLHQPTSTITNLAAATAPSAKLNEKRTSLKIVMPGGGPYGALAGRTAAEDPNAVGSERRLRPCEHQLKQEPLLFLGFGLSDPKQGLIGILPELIGL